MRGLELTNGALACLNMFAVMFAGPYEPIAADAVIGAP